MDVPESEYSGTSHFSAHSFARVFDEFMKPIDWGIMQ